MNFYSPPSSVSPSDDVADVFNDGIEQSKKEETRTKGNRDDDERSRGTRPHRCRPISFLALHLTDSRNNGKQERKKFAWWWQDAAKEIREEEDDMADWFWGRKEKKTRRSEGYEDGDKLPFSFRAGDGAGALPPSIRAPLATEEGEDGGDEMKAGGGTVPGGSGGGGHITPARGRERAHGGGGKQRKKSSGRG